MFGGLVKGVIRSFLMITGTGPFYDLWKENTALAIMLLACVALTVVWMIRFFPSAAAGAGKTIGSLAWSFIKLSIAVGIVIGLVNMIIDMGLSMIVGGIASIWLIGPPLAKFAGWIIGGVKNVIVMIAMGYFILKSIQSILGQVTSFFSSAMQEWKADNGKGIDGVKIFPHIIAACLVGAAFICHPAWNTDYYFAPALASGLAGIVSLFVTTKGGRKQLDYARARVGNGILADGSSICQFVGDLPLYDKKAWARRGKKRPLLDEDGNPRVRHNHKCNFHNKAGNKVCGSDVCDAPCVNVDWMHCGQRISYTVNKCPECGARKPKPKKPKAFHYPWEDKFQAAEPVKKQVRIAGGWQCRHQVVVRTPAGKLIPKGFDPTTGEPLRAGGHIIPKTRVCGEWNSQEATHCSKCNAPRPGAQPQVSPLPVSAPQPLVFKEPVLEMSCLNCGRPYDASRGYTTCVHCGNPLHVRSGAAPAAAPKAAPAAPTPAPASAPTTRVSRGAQRIRRAMN